LMLHRMMIHCKGTPWLNEELRDFTQTADALRKRGIDFDLVSDRQLNKEIWVRDKRLTAGNVTYKVLVLAGCRRMPLDTFQRIHQLIRAGANVVVLGPWPDDVPGLGNLEKQQNDLTQLQMMLNVDPGRGQWIRGNALESMLAEVGVRREVVTDRGVRVIRRVNDDGWTYFLVNHGNNRLDDWVSLSVQASSAVLFDPLHARRGMAAVQPGMEGYTKVYLQLEPGESIVVRALRKKIEGPAWQYLTPQGEPVVLTGPWKVTFLEGGPTLPEPITLPKLASWTEPLAEGDSEAQLHARRAFSGTARYAVTFTKPSGPADAWILDLGHVADSARVTLNGKPLVTLIAQPMRIPLGDAVQEGENRLELEVTNLMANRIIDMNARGVPWCLYYFVYIQSGRYDRRGVVPKWQPFPSGLLGPVRLIPGLKKVPGTKIDKARGSW
ncbi:MAG: hypothetical protein JW818_16705, partial [Pirellulales bacterium]|nr:hypothetical protein [Pirellulales bacterium]